MALIMIRFEESNQIFDWAQSQDLRQLRENAVNEQDSSKQTVLLALYDYALQQQQQKVVSRPNFIR